MTKSKIHKKRIMAFLVVLTLVLLGTFNLSSIYAIEWEGDGATFDPDDSYPTQYGVFIPQPNMFSTMSIDASNQGNFTMMDWLGGVIDSEVVDYQGTDISHLYPWDFDNYLKATPTSNDYIDPWDIDWMNITAYNPYSVNLSSYRLNSIFDYYVMIEGNTLNVPVHSGFPLQIDVMIESTGPKILKFDWLTDDNTIDPLNLLVLVSPSGKLLYIDVGLVQHAGITWAQGKTDDLFWYTTFVAQETGTYRLLVEAAYTEPMSLSLEFINTQVTNLPMNKLTFEGNVDDNPSMQDLWDVEWQNNWIKFTGEEGDIFKLDIGIDHGNTFPTVNIWYPCENGYVRDELFTPEGTHDISLPATGSVYVSFIDEMYAEWYRYSLFLNEMEVFDYNIGDNLTSVKVDKDQRKAIEFEIEEDSFVRFNYTLHTQPAGDPWIYAPGEPFGFVYLDSNKLECYDIISALDEKIVGTETFYYYYLPAGTYQAYIANTDVEFDGIIQLSSKYVDFVNSTIPINSLTYPDIDPSQFIALNFDPDEYYNGIYEAQYLYLNITEPGQYFLNATISASDHLAGLPTTTSPSVVLVYNSSIGVEEYFDYTTQALAFDNNTFKAFYEVGDQLYIAYNSKWHDIELNLTQVGAGGEVSPPEVYLGSDTWDYLQNSLDTTSEFTDNGTWILDMNDPGDDYDDWIPGVGSEFDLPHIDENQFYWIRFECDNDYNTDIPFIDLIQLSNITMQGDINLALVGESGYEYCDYWEPYIDTSLDLLINQESENLDDTVETWLFENSVPRIIGLEEGLYKLLIIPYGWGYQGPLQIDFAIGNWWSYRHEQFYNITEDPNLYQYQINNYTANWYGPDNITTYSYGLTTSYNHTEASIMGGGPSYFVLDSYGDAYMWTQLVVSTNNVSSYNLYLMQDLPWIDNNGPNNEVEDIALGVTVNKTFEFGVHTDLFYLIFEVSASADLVTFRIDLNQYNTTALYSNEITASYTPPSTGDILVLTLAIVIPTVAGAVVVVLYVLKKKGRILTKTPSR